MAATSVPWLAWAPPAAALALLGADHAGVLHADDLTYMIIAPPVLILTVFAAVHHAETVSIRVGDALGAIVLAVAVTTIEVSLIASIMLEAGAEAPTVARDTVFAGLMIVLNGIVGASLLTGALRHREQIFQLQGTASALAVLGALAGIVMVLPAYTISEPGPYYTFVQLMFVATVSLSLYAVYVGVQAGSQKRYFSSEGSGHEAHAPVTGRSALIAAAMLVVSLLAVVLLADSLAPALQEVVRGSGLPQEFVAVIIAVLVLLPEGVSAIHAARSNRIQTSLNLAIGSAIASTGLTIPAIALLAVVLDMPVALGLEPEHMTLLALTLFVSTTTLSTGRTTILQGSVHLVLFVVFLVIAAVP